MPDKRKLGQLAEACGAEIRAAELLLMRAIVNVDALAKEFKPDVQPHLAKRADKVLKSVREYHKACSDAAASAGVTVFSGGQDKD